MKRAQVLQAIKAAGAYGDQAAFCRLYVEHRISYQVALKTYREGAAFAAFVAKRDEKEASQ